MEFDFDKYIDEEMENLGLNPKHFTKDQKYNIIEPISAPENYHCDGLITPQQAKIRWVNNLKKSGLSKGQILLVREKLSL